ncbi:RNA-binding protein [Actinomycetospora sp. NBRC 106375]|nr:RNA-binding protein [Actinomycetospora sp. NBRC 106375]
MHTRRVEQRTPIRDVEIRDESIRLGQLLKLAGLVEHGAAARQVLDAGEVTVNGRDEDRRGRQLVPGDVVALAGERIRVRRPPDG